MKNKIYCKTTGKGQQSYYLTVNGEDYFLFTQKFRRSNKEFFANGVTIDEALNWAGQRSESVIRTMRKLPSYISFVESEYGISVLKKTKKRQENRFKAYKRERLNWRNIDWEAA